MSEAHNSKVPRVGPGRIEILVIEPGSAAWSVLKLAIENEQKVSLNPRGFGRYAIKRGEHTWSATLMAGDSAAPFSERGAGPFRQSEAPPNT